MTYHLDNTVSIFRPKINLFSVPIKTSNLSLFLICFLTILVYDYFLKKCPFERRILFGRVLFFVFCFCFLFFKAIWKRKQLNKSIQSVNKHLSSVHSVESTRLHDVGMRRTHNPLPPCSPK